MKKENDILAELKEWGSPLADMSREMPHSVPEKYFASLTDDIAFFCANDPRVDTVAKGIPFTVPANYFDTLPQQLLKSAKSDANDLIRVDDMPTVKKVPGKKVINLIPNYWHRAAVAAMLIMGIGVCVFRYISSHDANPEKQLAQISKSSLHEYLVHQNLNYSDSDVINLSKDNYAANATKQLNKADIEQYLEETGLKTEYNIN